MNALYIRAHRQWCNILMQVLELNKKLQLEIPLIMRLKAHCPNEKELLLIHLIPHRSNNPLKLFISGH